MQTKMNQERSWIGWMDLLDSKAKECAELSLRRGATLEHSRSALWSVTLMTTISSTWRAKLSLTRDTSIERTHKLSLLQSGMTACEAMLSRKTSQLIKGWCSPWTHKSNKALKMQAVTTCLELTAFRSELRSMSSLREDSLHCLATRASTVT